MDVVSDFSIGKEDVLFDPSRQGVLEKVWGNFARGRHGEYADGRKWEIVSSFATAALEMRTFANEHLPSLGGIKLDEIRTAAFNQWSEATMPTLVVDLGANPRATDVYVYAPGDGVAVDGTRRIVPTRDVTWNSVPVDGETGRKNHRDEIGLNVCYQKVGESGDGWEPVLVTSHFSLADKHTQDAKISYNLKTGGVRVLFVTDELNNHFDDYFEKETGDEFRPSRVVSDPEYGEKVNQMRMSFLAKKIGVSVEELNGPVDVYKTVRSFVAGEVMQTRVGQMTKIVA